MSQLRHGHFAGASPHRPCNAVACAGGRTAAAHGWRGATRCRRRPPCPCQRGDMDVRRRPAQGAFPEMKFLRGLLNNIEVGARRPLLVRRERVANISARKRLLFASDLHLRKNGPRHIIDGLLEIAWRERPDVILLGGDLADWRSGLEALQSLVRGLSRVAMVFAVAGNHDRWVGVARVRAVVVAGGGRWLEDAPWFLTPDCVIYGSCEQPV